MKIPVAFALMSAFCTSACALLAGSGPQDDALLKTQVQPEALASCIGNKFNVPATPMDKGGYAVDAAGTRLIIERDKVQTIVRVDGGVTVPENVSSQMVQCALSLTPRSGDAT